MLLLCAMHLVTQEKVVRKDQPSEPRRAENAGGWQSRVPVHRYH